MPIFFSRGIEPDRIFHRSEPINRPDARILCLFRVAHQADVDGVHGAVEIAVRRRTSAGRAASSPGHAGRLGRDRDGRREVLAGVLNTRCCARGRLLGERGREGAELAGPLQRCGLGVEPPG